jgi:hypothetical protein
MFSFSRSLSLFALVAFPLFITSAGCSKIGEAIDCDQLCDKMKDCLDSDLNVRSCAEKCEDRVEDDTLADKLDRCTDCLDRGVSCREMADECSVCDEVQVALAP